MARIDVLLNEVRDLPTAIRALCQAVVYQAERDAEHGDKEAAEWLRTSSLAREIYGKA